MTRTLPAPLPTSLPTTAPPAAGDAIPVPRRLPGRVAVCAVVTLLALAGAVVGTPLGRGTALVLAMAVAGWGGWPLHRAAAVALRRGAPTADALPAAGILLLCAAAACAAPGTTGAVALVAPAAATTLLLAGRALDARVRGRAGDGTDTGALDEAVARTRRGMDTVARVADRAADGVAPVVAALAVAALGFWLGAGAGPGAAVGAAAAVLLAACPRAVGGAASVALIGATARAAALGARSVAPRVLERAARVDTVVLCRTGTLTGDARRLEAVHVAGGTDPDEALRIAGAVATAAADRRPAGRHPVGAVGTVGPVGTVVARAARDRFGALPGVAEFDGHPGLGARGVVTELCVGADDEPRVIAHATLVGRPALLAEHGIELPDELAEAVARAHSAGTTPVAVSWDGVARAVLEVADPVRPGSAELVREVRALGMTPVLLTGDDADVARGAAAVVGIDPGQVLAVAARDDRAAAVAALQAQGRTVAVLGGPDDAAALAAADVALVRPDGFSAEAGGASGPDSPGESCVPTRRVPRSGTFTVPLTDDDPLAAVDLLRLARRTVRSVERSLTAAVAYHLVALPAAAAGVLPPLAAALAGAACPIVAVLHAAAVRRVRAVPRPDPC